MSKLRDVRSVRSDFTLFGDEAKISKISILPGPGAMYVEVCMRHALPSDMGNGYAVNTPLYKRAEGRDVYLLNGRGEVEHHQAGVTLSWEDILQTMQDRRLYVVAPQNEWRSSATRTAAPAAAGVEAQNALPTEPAEAEVFAAFDCTLARWVLHNAMRLLSNEERTWLSAKLAKP